MEEKEKKNIHTFKVVSHIQNTTFHFLPFRTVSIINLYEILKNYYKIYEHYERLAYRRKMDGNQVFREISRHPFNTYATRTYETHLLSNVYTHELNNQTN